MVGTAYVHDEDPEPTKGRVIVLSLETVGDGKVLTMVGEKVVKGAVYQARPLEVRFSTPFSRRVE